MMSDDYNNIVELLGTPAVMDYEQAAAFRRISVRTLRNYIAIGRLDVPTYSIGNKKYMKRDDLIEAIKKEKSRKLVYQ